MAHGDVISKNMANSEYNQMLLAYKGTMSDRHDQNIIKIMPLKEP